MTTRFDAFKWYSWYVLTIPILCFQAFLCFGMGLWTVVDFGLSLVGMLLLTLMTSLVLSLMILVLAIGNAGIVSRLPKEELSQMVMRDLDPTGAVNGIEEHCSYNVITSSAWFALGMLSLGLMAGLWLVIVDKQPIFGISDRQVLQLSLLLGLVGGLLPLVVSAGYLYYRWWPGTFSRLIVVMGCCGRYFLQDPFRTAVILQNARKHAFRVETDINNSDKWRPL
ncbi:MAG: hypothetical protein NT141_01435 [candidate division WWE3 bacterium]|nr:hypothetical protein [candidate division WWE3 bacterium]